jgi:hypothetical protein
MLSNETRDGFRDFATAAAEPGQDRAAADPSLERPSE